MNMYGILFLFGPALATSIRYGMVLFENKNFQGIFLKNDISHKKKLLLLFIYIYIYRKVFNGTNIPISPQ